MAKTTAMNKKITNPTAKKANKVTGADKTPAKEVEQKKLTVEPAAKKLTTAKAPEKIAAAKEPKKITAAKAPEKITAKPEPKKIAEKTKAKAEEKKVDKDVSEKAEVTTTKEEVKTVKAEPKKAAAVKKEPKPKAVKAEKTKSAKSDKTASKATKPEKTDKKAPSKKVVEKSMEAKAPVSEKNEAYQAYSVDECIAKLQLMGIMHTYEDYTHILLNEADLKKIEMNIVEGNALKETMFDFHKDGCDVDLIAAALVKIADTMDIKAKDFAEIKKDMNACVKTSIGKDDEKKAAEYLKEFKVCEKILMIAQRKNYTTSQAVTELIGSDVDAFVKHFFDFAYAILPDWQYDDVKFYEDFAYALLSQYTDLYDKYQLRLLIDVADLYIKHGDFLHGDEAYGYILRDNQIKDYIYYRFVSVYEAIDFNKAKGLAYESLQYVDNRYQYYSNIMDVINR